MTRGGAGQTAGRSIMMQWWAIDGLSGFAAYSREEECLPQREQDDCRSRRGVWLYASRWGTAGRTPSNCAEVQHRRNCTMSRGQSC